MWVKLWKRSFWAAMALLVLIALLGAIGSTVPHHMLRVAGSPTSETYLLVSFRGVGYERIDDPSGFAIPYRDRMMDVVDGSSAIETRSFRVPLFLDGARGSWRGRQGGRIESVWWGASLLPWGALALLVLVAHGLALAGRKVRATADERARRRREARYAGEQRCPGCGYDVRAADARCPECGQAFVRRTVVLPALEAERQR